MSQIYRIVFFGSSEISLRPLSELLAAPGFEVVAVVTKAPPTQGHTSTQDTPVAHLAQQHNLPLLRPVKISDALEDIARYAPNLGVLFAYGQLLPASLLELFPLGIINIHPSLLPLHRGPSPIEATILAGDSIAGTSLMRIEPELDSGPILAQDQWSISSHISKLELTEQLVSASCRLLVPTLQDYCEDRLIPVPQENAQASYCPMIRKQDGLIDPSIETALQLERKVRAYAGWPGTALAVTVAEQPTTLKLHAVSIVEPDTVHPKVQLIRRDKHLVLELNQGSLRIDQAQLPNRKIVQGQDLLNGPAIALTLA